MPNIKFYVGPRVSGKTKLALSYLSYFRNSDTVMYCGSSSRAYETRQRVYTTYGGIPAPVKTINRIDESKQNHTVLIFDDYE